jgi:DNA-binding NtrC family response regulator
MPLTAQSLWQRIFVLAPDSERWRSLKTALSRRGYNVASSDTALDAFKYFAEEKVDLILVDTAVTNGSVDELARVVERALAQSSERPETVTEISRVSRRGNGLTDRKGAKLAVPSVTQRGTRLIGHSPPISNLLQTIERVAPIDSNVLITGGTGTGKELVARAIHDRSRRRSGNFVDINCSAIPETLFETEFFGHERGTFTGANETRQGLFEKASGGTLFLDEVGTLSPAMQAKLLRVLQERQIRRVGGRENIPVDVRIIAATNSDLKAAVTRGEFRPDLYFRLRVVPLHMPQLRGRRQDIPLLIEHFLQRHNLQSGEPPRRFSLEAMSALLAYSWPGNVRELENVVEYAVAIGSSPVLGVDDLPPDMFGERQDEPNLLGECVSSNAPLAEVERRYILAVFERCDRHHVKTAAVLRIDRRTLYRKLQQYDLELSIRDKVSGL